jgi:hypothetical protein
LRMSVWPVRQPHPHAGRNQDHRRANALTTRASAVPSTSAPTMMHPVVQALFPQEGDDR